MHHQQSLDLGHLQGRCNVEAVMQVLQVHKDLLAAYSRKCSLQFVLTAIFQFPAKLNSSLLIHTI